MKGTPKAFNGLIFFGIITLFISCQNKKQETHSFSDDIAHQSKNVLFIIVDDLRPEINAWGQEYIKTPNIDKLAKKGISFTNAYCQYANCSPSRKSILTGLSPESTGHQGNFNEYDRVMNHTTMPDFFKEHGYYTGSFGKVYHDARDDRDSWDFYYDVGDPEKPENVPWECYGSMENQNIKNKTDRPATESEDLPLENYNDYKVCQTALKQLEENKNKKFFLTIGFRKPHLPFAVPKKYWDLYKRENIPASEFPEAPLNGDTIVYQWSELAAYQHFSTNYKTSNYREKKVSPDKSKELRHGYFACVSYIYDLVGMLLNKLDELKIDDNTIVALLGDHGYHLGDQQIWGKHSCYELSTRVPLIIYDPSAKENKNICNKFVELLDLYPTLAEICGLSSPKDLDGKSFADLFNDINADGFDAVFNQYQTFQNNPAIKNLMPYAAHTNEYNYIEWQDLGNNKEVVQRELYHLNDPKVEMESIVSENHENIIQELSQKIENKFKPYRLKYKQFGELAEPEKK